MNERYFRTIISDFFLRDFMRFQKKHEISIMFSGKPPNTVFMSIYFFVFPLLGCW